MNYQETVDWLFQQLPVFQKQGASAYKKDLSNTEALLSALGNPENKFKSIHIGGTNGKGSIAHNLAASLHFSGYKTGLYTSPHLVDFRERIKINGSFIPKSYVQSWVQDNMSIIQEIQPSFFELTVALSFNYFADANVDIAVIEVGMGGRLDSTNVIRPELTVISNVSLDHQQFLGSSLDLIAKEKAGIIKPDTPVIIGEYDAATWPVFYSIAKAKNAEILKAYELEIAAEHCVEGLALYQRINFRTSMCSLLALRRLGYSVEPESLVRTVRNKYEGWNFRGRMHFVQQSPAILLDAAHNQAGLKLLFDELQKTSYTRIHWVFACTQEKKLKEVLPKLPPQVDMYLCEAEIPRSKKLSDLAEEIKTLTNVRFQTKSVRDAIYEAIRNQKHDELVLIAGSIFLLGEAYQALEHIS